MDHRLVDGLLRAGGVLLTAVGLVVVLAGYLGMRDEADVALQLPYVMSGGLGGLALVGLGVVLVLHAQLREQARQAAEITDQLEDWKEAALAEIRSFLEGAQIEVELREPRATATNGSARRAARTSG